MFRARSRSRRGYAGLTTLAWSIGVIVPAALFWTLAVHAAPPADPGDGAGVVRPKRSAGPPAGAPPPSPPAPAADGVKRGDAPSGEAGVGGLGPVPPSPTPSDPKRDPQSTRRETELFADRLDGLQSDTNALKEKIFRSKARLQLLKDTVLQGVMAGSRVVLSHRNRMGSQFRLVKMSYILDGAQIEERSDDSGALDAEDEIVIYDGNIPPGPHTVTIVLTYRGQGFGAFSYMSDYTFESRSSYNFTATESGAMRLTSVGFERGNLTTEMKDRPAVDWQAIALDASGKPLPKSKGGSDKGPRGDKAGVKSSGGASTPPPARGP